MSTFGEELVRSLEEALAHSKGEGPAVMHTPVSPREVRLQASLTQPQMARLMGMSLSGYRKWEQGTRSVNGPAETLLRAMQDTMLPGGRPNSELTTVSASPPGPLRAKVEALDDFPELRHRLTRSISWLDRAHAGNGADAACVFSWIAFNAAYAINRNADFRERPRKGTNGNADLSTSSMVVPLDAERIYQHLANELSASIRELVGNEYVYHGFWRSLGDEPFDWASWPGREQFERECDDVDRLLRSYRSNRRLSKPRVRAVRRVLTVLFDRLYVLRNQLIHGCATHQGQLNRRQVNEGALILTSLIPIFIDIMADHPRENWGPISFPVRDDIREDRRSPR